MTTFKNDQPYIVQVRAVDNAGNTGPCSSEVSGTPRLVDDFWRLYKKDGGTDTGSTTDPHAVHLDIINKATTGGVPVTRPAPAVSYSDCKI